MKRILRISILCGVALTTSLSVAAPAVELPKAEDSTVQGSKEVTDHYFRGVTFESSGRLDDAVREYRKVLQMSPGNGDARRRLADIHLLRGERTPALEQFKELARYQPRNPVIHFRLAQLYEASGNQRKASAEYREVTRITPKSIPASRKLARLYEKRKMNDEAAAEYRKILSVDNNDTTARNSLMALYLREKKYDDLTEFLRERAEQSPDDATGHYKLGVVYEFREKYDNAAVEYGKAVELEAGNGKFVNALARVYQKTGKEDEAKKLLEAAARENPGMKGLALPLQSMQEEFSSHHADRKRKFSKKHKKNKSAKVTKKKYSKKHDKNKITKDTKKKRRRR